MAPRFRTILTGRNLPKITGQPGDAEPSIINEKTVADFARVVELTGILQRERPTGETLGTRARYFEFRQRKASIIAEVT